MNDALVYYRNCFNRDCFKHPEKKGMFSALDVLELLLGDLQFQDWRIHPGNSFHRVFLVFVYWLWPLDLRKEITIAGGDQGVLSQDSANAAILQKGRKQSKNQLDFYRSEKTIEDYRGRKKSQGLLKMTKTEKIKKIAKKFQRNMQKIVDDSNGGIIGISIEIGGEKTLIAGKEENDASKENKTNTVTRRPAAE